jgi:hypothetical protein
MHDARANAGAFLCTRHWCDIGLLRSFSMLHAPFIENHHDTENGKGSVFSEKLS